MEVKEIKELIIKAGEKAVMELIEVAKSSILVRGAEDDLSADRLKNAAAAKKLAIFDAFEILNRIEEERKMLEMIDSKDDTTKHIGFAERNSK